MSDLPSPSESWAVLALKNLPHDALVALLRAFGGPAQILAASSAALGRVVPDTAVARLRKPLDPDLVERVRRWLAEPGHELITWDDPDYPRALLDLGFAPPALYFVGRRELLNRPALAIVGSRNATAQGRDNAHAFARALSAAGLTIVSGLALGIDGAAHRGGLEGGDSATLAVVGTGLDRVYPARHRDLARTIAAQGGLVSEFPPGTPPAAWNFPRRNRLISGLARGVLVVEAALSSGSLTTARHAGEQGREVFAIPGSIHSPLSRGCHRLLRDGAKLVETAQDVLVELGLAPDGAAALSPTAAPANDLLLCALGHDPVDVDTLVERTALPAEAVITRLTELELDGRVGRIAGGNWQRRDGADGW
jgi:DNA processing protein